MSEVNFLEGGWYKNGYRSYNAKTGAIGRELHHFQME